MLLKYLPLITKISREFDRLDDVPVPDDSIVFSVAGEELIPCLGEKNKYTCRPTARYRYKLCAYPDGFSGVQYIANSFIEPPPKKINISAQDLAFISGDADLILHWSDLYGLSSGHPVSLS